MGVDAQAPIESELTLITPVSKFIHDAALKAFADYAKEKWNVTVKTNAIPAGTPVAYGRIVEWKGRPEADIFWGGESALFEKLAEQKLLQKVEISKEAWDSIPASIGKPKPIPLKDKDGYWIGTALEPYGLVYHPGRSSGSASPSRRTGTICSIPSSRARSRSARPPARRPRTRPTRSSSRCTARTRAGSGSRSWPPTPATSPRAAGTCRRWWPRASSRPGFAVPSYMAFEEKLAGFDIKFVAPKNAFVTPEPMAILAGARNPKAARAFIEFLLTERGQRVFMERGLFPITPKYKVQGAPGSTAEMAVEFTGGVRSYFDGEVSNVYDEAVAAKRSEALKTRFRSDIEAVWKSPN